MSDLDMIYERVKTIPLSLLVKVNEIDRCPCCGVKDIVFSDSKKIYKCFTCGIGGDNIKLYKDLYNLEFVEAIKVLNSLLIMEEYTKEKGTPS